jgi:hypothetical protein
LIAADKVRATASAFQGARGLGIPDLAGMCAVIMALTSADFTKSMTVTRITGFGRTFIGPVRRWGMCT